ncbi:hypothetical protein J3R83DRAFT_4636 [Lanmaoa asiatica]|nr:hypothetical protein J3R83DRAFT_4636 [Lanmaoa asiatica]
MAKFLRGSGLKPNSHILGIDVFKEFDDDLTLDNLSRPQLVSMCRYMGINAFGVDNFLRGAIHSCLVNLRRDDEGDPCYRVSPARLRDKLSTWSQLHLHNGVSGVLLILGRAAEVDSDNASYKQKLEVLQQQEEFIEDEQEQEQKEDARRARHTSWMHVLLNCFCLTESCIPFLKMRVPRAMEEILQAEEVSPMSLASIRPSSHPFVGPQVSFRRADQADPDKTFRDRRSTAGIRSPAEDLEKALAVIKHRPDDEVGQVVIQKLDADKDGFVEIEHVLGLVRKEDFGEYLLQE